MPFTLGSWKYLTFQRGKTTTTHITHREMLCYAHEVIPWPSNTSSILEFALNIQLLSTCNCKVQTLHLAPFAKCYEYDSHYSSASNIYCHLLSFPTLHPASATSGNLDASSSSPLALGVGQGGTLFLPARQPWALRHRVKMWHVEPKAM